MNENEIIPEQQEFGIEEQKAPFWLLFVYFLLLTWSVWNLFKYWD